MIYIEKIDVIHLEEITNLFIQAFGEAPWNEKWPYERAYKRLNAIYQTDRFVGYMAMEDSKIVGALMGNLEYWYEGDNYNLKELFTHSKDQGRGIGSMLLKALENHFEGRCINEKMLLTIDSPKTIKFYEKNGYTLDRNLVMMKQ